MRYLLDTCAFLWFAGGDERLSGQLQGVLVDSSSEVYLSVISVWEAVVKSRLGRLSLLTEGSPWRFMRLERERHGISSLPLDDASVAHLEKLPPLHRDPFDRMLICQAMENGLTLVTADQTIASYPIKSILIGNKGET